jgi:SAM-dependent methyltransferase
VLCGHGGERRVTHNAAIRREFSKQAATFEDPAYSFGNPRLLGWILSHVPHRETDLVLDVAAGTGHLSRALAPHVRAGIENVVFQIGDAATLPFLDHSFDLVVSRFALHHFLDPRVQLEEMCRVCRREGRVAIVDLVSAEPHLSEQYNRWERLRDPTHTEALTQEGLHRLLGECGLRLESSTHHDQVLQLERWLQQAATDDAGSERIRLALREELAGGAPTGMRPVAVAVRPNA